MRRYPEILVMRHGQTEWNRAGLMQGSLDSPLTERGRAQARGLNAILRHAGLGPAHRAWVSPQGRAQETARLALDGLFDNWTTDPRLAEISVGGLEGMSFNEAMACVPELQAHAAAGEIGWQFHAPGGEGWPAFSARIQSWLDDLDGPAVVVTHGVTSRVLRALVLGIGRDRLNTLPGGQGMIYRLSRGRSETLFPPGHVEDAKGLARRRPSV